MKVENSLKQVREHLGVGDITSAEVLTKKVLKKKSNNIDALFLLGCIEFEKKNYKDAIQLFKKVLKNKPDHETACQNLCVALSEFGKPEEALLCLKTITDNQPDNYIAHYNLGNVYYELGKLVEAKSSYERSMSINPAYTPIYNNLGLVNKQLGDISNAEKYYRKSISQAPTSEAYSNLITLLRTQDSPEAYSLALEIIKLPNPEGALVTAFPALIEACEWDVVDAICNNVLSIAKSETVGLRILQGLILSLNKLPNIDPKEILELHKLWGKRISFDCEHYSKYENTPESIDKIRIGYISPDFREHSVGYFIKNIIISHNKDEFDIYCYSKATEEDLATEEIRLSAHAFVDVSNMSDEDVARKIHDDGIQILVDLAGHTTNSGLPALRFRPAPVQMTYLGYPSTTGLDAVDYRITDNFAEVEEGRTLYTEELLKMPESFLCFGEFPVRPIEVTPPVRKKGYVTFGSFNHVSKLNPEVIHTWSAILNKVPHSRLVIKSGGGDRGYVKKNVFKEFAKHDVGEDRVDIVGYLPDKSKHFDFYNDIDITLDTFPYNGTTTTCEALWMGVPVITLVGKAHAQRVSYSILKNIGIEDTITETEELYIDKAVELALDKDKLQELRQRIPQAIRNSILCEPKKFTRQLEELYKQAWKDKELTALYEPEQVNASNEAQCEGPVNNQYFLEQAKQDFTKGNITAAENNLLKVLKKSPNDPGGLFLMGCVENSRRQYDKAIRNFQKVLSINPGHYGAYYNMGVTLNESGRLEEALVPLNVAVENMPDDYKASFYIGSVYQNLGYYSEAKQAFLKAVSLQPDPLSFDLSSTYHNLGTISKELDEIDEAINYLKKSLKINKNNFNAHTTLLSILGSTHDPEAYKYALDAVKNNCKGNTLLSAYPILLKACNWDVANSLFPYVIAWSENDEANAGTNEDCMYSLNSSPDIKPDKMFEIHKHWGKKISSQCELFTNHSGINTPVKKLRIAYLSSDLRRHSVGLFMRDVIKAHDSEKFEIYCYSNSQIQDETTSIIRKSVFAFMGVWGMTKKDIAQRIYEDGIHILIDLAGHTGKTMLDVMIYRPAPVQITYLGYPNTTGLETVDYRITDVFSEAEGGTLYTEELLKMPESFLCFSSFEDVPIRNDSSSRKAEGIVFGSFNNTSKLTPDVVRIWGEILDRVPNSILIIKAPEAKNDYAKKNIYQEFSRHGIGEERISLHGLITDTREHLDFYNNIDIALDTFPYNGTTTTCEALWMGVPVITLVGKVHAQRVSYSILKNIGIEDTITFTEEEYIEKAAMLATNPDKLKSLRTRVPIAIRESILCNPEKFTRQLEELYKQAWLKKGYTLAEEEITDIEIVNYTSQSDNILEAKKYIEDGKIIEADEIIQKILMRTPDNLDALFLSGTIEGKKGNNEKSIAILSDVIEKNPDQLNARLNLGVALMELRDFKKAKPHFERILEAQPDNHLALNNLGNMHKESGDMDEALVLFEKSISVNPDYWVALFNIGNIYLLQNNAERAIHFLIRAFELNKSPDVYVCLISALKLNKDFEKAYAIALKYTITMDYSDVLLSIATIFYELCDWGMIDKIRPELLILAKDFNTRARFIASMLMSVNSYDDISAQEVYDIHHIWGEKTAANKAQFSNYNTDVSENHRIKIGYISSDFKQHSVSFFIRNIIKSHDRNLFDIFCYSNTAYEDELTQNIRSSADHFIAINKLTDEQVAQRIYDDGIHILIDLGGHTASSRISCMAYRPSPIQVTYLGYPNTTGLESMDFRITDDYAEAEGGTLYVEELLKMPESFLCFGAFPDRPIESASPIFTKGHVTFASFNNLSKITPSVVKVWSKILNQIPDSRLVIKAERADTSIAQDNICNEFSKHNIGEDRIDFHGFINGVENHLDFHNQIDIMFDTFPYNGTTTTCEALWMGVPVITLVGKAHAQRVSYSILKNIGIEDTITETEDLYINKAVELALDKDKLQALRQRIPEAIRNSILCNPEEFTHQLEELYKQAWVKKGYMLPEVEEIVQETSIPSENKSNKLDSLLSLTIKGGIHVCLPNSLDLMTPYILLEQEDWFEVECDFVRHMLQSGMNIMDVGANYGIYTLISAKKIESSGKVWAIEPARKTAAYLAESLKENNFHNVKLIEAGLSDKSGTAYITSDQNSELNVVKQNKGTKGAHDKIKLFSLDDGMKVYQWNNIDFIKMDAEGHELRILEGGKVFLETNSPLIMYEIRHDEGWNIDLINRFPLLGYRNYRYISGLDLLVPFNMNHEIEASQLNLFCCKSDRAELLEERGLLIQNPLLLEEVGAPSAGKWIDYLQQFPYAIRLLTPWLAYIKAHSESTYWILHQHALDYYALAHDKNESARDRYGYLMRAYKILDDLQKKNRSFSNTLSFIRIAYEIGERAEAAYALKYLISEQESGVKISFDEPFLSVSLSYESVEPEGNIEGWIHAMILEQYEKLHSHSSFFTEKDSLRKLDVLKNTGFQTCEMERRSQLIRLRFNLQQAPEPEYFPQSECNLNHWFWSTEPCSKK